MDRLDELPLRAVKLFRARNGMTAMARTPLLPEPTLVGALSAQLRRPRPQPAVSALRRLRPSAAQRRCDGVDSEKCTIGPWAPGPQRQPRGGLEFESEHSSCGQVDGSESVRRRCNGRPECTGLRSIVERDGCAMSGRSRCNRDGTCPAHRLREFQHACALFGKPAITEVHL
jgi:hypothetical protein